ncbi:MAG: class I SAM-dependent methyltransferase [Ktedonobacteraceae bacterium]
MAEITNTDVINAWSRASQEIVANFGDEGDFTRRNLLNPIIFGLVGDVSGKTILDAGCGQGYLSRLLAKKGAAVTGIEPAEPWYTYAVQREQAERLGIRYVQEDLSVWAAVPNTFDYVIANMVFMDIPDFLLALRSCIATLKREGGLIFSLLHPCFEESGSAWKEKGFVEVRDYFQERMVQQTYAHFIHRPLSTYINSVVQEGCTLQKVIEPQLDEAIARQYQAERYCHVPGYLVISATKSSYKPERLRKK